MDYYGRYAENPTAWSTNIDSSFATAQIMRSVMTNAKLLLSLYDTIYLPS